MKFILVWTILAVAPLTAQQSEVSLKIDMVSWGDEIGGLSFKAGDKSSEITALPFRYSVPASYSGPAIMEIFKNGDGKKQALPELSKEDKEHEMIPLNLAPLSPPAEKDGSAKTGIALELEKRRVKNPTLVALAQLPVGCRRATVLLVPSAGGTFIAYVIDDDPSKLPLGQLRVHNLSPHSIAMRVNGSASKELKTREAMVVPAPDQQISYDIAYQMDGEWKFQEHNIIPIRSQEQTQMIVLRSDNQFFRSSDGASGGFLQIITLRRRSGP